MSIPQTWVRPIVRGEANFPVEFGAKVFISMVDGFVALECLPWDAYNEGTTMQETVKRYRFDTGFYPEKILADKIYRTSDNLVYCCQF